MTTSPYTLTGTEIPPRPRTLPRIAHLARRVQGQGGDAGEADPATDSTQARGTSDTTGNGDARWCDASIHADIMVASNLRLITTDDDILKTACHHHVGMRFS